ncbi:MAG: nucleotidyltransferase family protein [Bryobacteraceae bacterium]
MTAGIILAAGASSRMGTPKALLDYQGETFLDRLIRVLGTVCDPLIVALGYHAAEIRAAARGRAQFVVNPDPARGQLSSLQTALAEVPQDADGFLFTPVDCPAAEPETVRAIVDAFHSLKEYLLVIPQYEGQHGHPLCARRELIAEFLALPATGQAKEIVRRHQDRTHYFDTLDAGVLSDIDDPQAYRILQGQR